MSTSMGAGLIRLNVIRESPNVVVYGDDPVYD